MQLLTQNSDLKKSGIYGWTLPAHWATLTDGTKFNTCPNAGVCAAFCYAKNGTYNFKNVKKAHVEKLELVLSGKWYRLILEELQNKKYIGKYIRIYDAGDFFSMGYAIDWINLAILNPKVNFYAYTKEVSLFKFLAIPFNFTVIYSFGGKQDHLIDREVDRHSDVFYDYDKMIQAGYVDISEDDKQAAVNPNHKIGLYRNNIKHLIKKMGENNFSNFKENHAK